MGRNQAFKTDVWVDTGEVCGVDGIRRTVANLLPKQSRNLFPIIAGESEAQSA